MTEIQENNKLEVSDISEETKRIEETTIVDPNAEVSLTSENITVDDSRINTGQNTDAKTFLNEMLEISKNQVATKKQKQQSTKVTSQQSIKAKPFINGYVKLDDNDKTTFLVELSNCFKKFLITDPNNERGKQKNGKQENNQIFVREKLYAKLSTLLIKSIKLLCNSEMLWSSIEYDKEAIVKFTSTDEIKTKTDEIKTKINAIKRNDPKLNREKLELQNTLTKNFGSFDCLDQIINIIKANNNNVFTDFISFLDKKLTKNSISYTYKNILFSIIMDTNSTSKLISALKGEFQTGGKRKTKKNNIYRKTKFIKKSKKNMTRKK
jgi:hypothetical protein